MKKSYAKPFLIAIFTLFVSISCDQQFDTPNRLTADSLLKDKDFLSFMSSAEEARQKVLFRQKDLVIFSVVNGVSKPDFDASLRNASASLEKIKQWAQTKDLAVRNKNLIVKELGFENLADYDQIEQNIQTKRGILVNKYPELLTLTQEARKELFLKVIGQWGKSPNAKTSFRENVICTNCFMNNCNSCGTGEGKSSDIWDPSGGCAERYRECIQNKATIRDASKNLALVVYIEYLIAQCGSTALEAGTWATSLGPQAGVLVGGLAFAGCALGATLIYSETLRLIEATYRDGILDCQEKFNCF